VIRRERLWERFLVDHLALDATQATSWACLLEHATVREVIDALDRFLGYPGTCPQGQPIPRSAEDRVTVEGRCLADAEVNETVRLVAFDDEDPEVLGYLRDRGLTVGATVRITEVGPRRSVIGIECEAGSTFIGADVAATIHIGGNEDGAAANADATWALPSRVVR
jgi:DtxR family Mn-dependent transcriptional regulator